MSTPKNPQLSKHLAAQQAKRSGQQPAKPGVAQPKTAQLKTAQLKTTMRKPAAPPVYRPQHTVKVLQTKPAGSPQVMSASSGHKTVAPPVYRPQPTPRVLQAKKSPAASQQPVNQSRPAPKAPAVYRPQPTPQVLQKKSAVIQQPHNMNSAPKQTAPPVYKPQPLPTVLQKKAISFPHTANSPKRLQQQPAPQVRAPSAQMQLRQTMSFPDHSAQMRGGAIQAMLTRRNVGSKDEEQQPSIQSSSNVNSVSSAVTTTVTFNEATAEAFNKSTGGADIKSEDKTFHMLSKDDRVWAVASGGTIKREYEALLAAQEAGMMTVLAGKMVKASIKNTERDAFPMRWVAGGISSKSQAPKFITELKKLKSNQTTLACLEKIKAAAKKVDLQDFQVLLNPQTGEIIVNDPRGHTAPGVDSIILKRVAEWEKALKDDSSSSSAQNASTSTLSEQDCMKLLEQGKLGLYHPGAVLQDFEIEDAQKILAGAKGPFKDKHNHDVSFVLKTAQGNFFFNASYL